MGMDNLTRGAQFVPGTMGHISEVLKSLPDYLENRAIQRNSVVRFGIQKLDEILWIGKGSQVVICAETGGGKTSLAAQAVAASENQKWGIFTLEMKAEAIVAKLASNLRYICLNRLVRGILTPTVWQ